MGREREREREGGEMGGEGEREREGGERERWRKNGLREGKGR